MSRSPTVFPALTSTLVRALCLSNRTAAEPPDNHRELPRAVRRRHAQCRLCVLQPDQGLCCMSSVAFGRVTSTHL